MITRTVVGFGLLVLVACTPTGKYAQPRIVRDESGAAFQLSGLGVSEIPGVTPLPPACDSGDASYYIGGFNQNVFIASKCPGQEGLAPDSTRCIVCETVTDCPDMGDRFECREGLCTDTRDWNMLPHEYLCGNAAPRVSRPVRTRLDAIVGALE